MRLQTIQDQPCMVPAILSQEKKGSTNGTKQDARECSGSSRGFRAGRRGASMLRTNRYSGGGTDPA
jgi:hypothetical protein